MCNVTTSLSVELAASQQEGKDRSTWRLSFLGATSLKYARTTSHSSNSSDRCWLNSFVGTNWKSIWTSYLRVDLNDSVRQYINLCINHDLRTIWSTTSLSITPPHPPKSRPLFCRIDCDGLKPARLLVCARLIPAILIVANGVSATFCTIPCDCIGNTILYTLRQLPSKYAVRVVHTFHSTLHNLWIWNKFVK